MIKREASGTYSLLVIAVRGGECLRNVILAKDILKPLQVRLVGILCGGGVRVKGWGSSGAKEK